MRFYKEFAMKLKLVSAVAFLMIILQAAVSAQVYVNRTFDEADTDAFYALSPVRKGNIIELYEHRDNSYVSMRKVNEKDLMINIPIDTKEKKLVFEGDFRLQNPGTACDIFVLKDAKDAFNYTLEVNAEGSLMIMSDNSKVMALDDDCFSTISIAADFEAHTFDLYINEILVREGAPMWNKTADIPTVARIYMGLGTKNTALDVDNIKIYSGEKIRDLNDGEYKKPSVGQMMELIDADGGTHPKLLADKQRFAEICENYAAGEKTTREWGDEIIKNADKIIPLEPAKYVLTSGGRLLSISQQTLSRMLTLGIAYSLTGNEKYVARALNELDAVTAFDDWCPNYYLDTSEMAAAAAIGYDWFYEFLGEERKNAVADAISRNALEISRQMYSVTPWHHAVSAANNWNAVCNGAMIMAAVAVSDEKPQLSAEIIRNAVRYIENIDKPLSPGGTWVEGQGYGEYAIRYLVNAASTLQNAYGTDFGLSQIPGLEKFTEYMLMSETPTGAMAYYDGAAYGHVMSGWIFWLADVFENTSVRDTALYCTQNYGIEPSVYGLLWYKPDTAAGFIPTDGYFFGGEMVSMRSAWDNANGVFLSFHGSSGIDIEHTHTDSGTFTFNMAGQRFAEDLGSDSYSLDGYLDTRRHEYYRRRPEGHNTLVINPDSGVGQTLKAPARVTRFEQNAKSVISAIDLTGAYSENVSAYTRGFRLFDQRREIEIRDEAELLNEENTIYWFMHTTATIDIVDSRTVILSKNGKRIYIKLRTNADSCKILQMNAEPLDTSPAPEGQNTNSGCKKLTFKLTGSGKIYIDVRISENVISSVKNTAIADWTLDYVENFDYDIRDISLTADGGEITVNYDIDINDNEGAVVVAAAFDGRKMTAAATARITKTSTPQLKLNVTGKPAIKVFVLSSAKTLMPVGGTYEFCDY